MKLIYVISSLATAITGGVAIFVGHAQEGILWLILSVLIEIAGYLRFDGEES